MALTGTFFLAICFALLLTVHGLKCFDKVENECPSDQVLCGSFSPISSNKELTETKCNSGVTMCSLLTVKSKGGEPSVAGAGYEVETVKAECVPEGTDIKLESGCYGREELKKINPDDAGGLASHEKLPTITIESVEICICDGDLCNGSIKSVFSISVIISSLIVSFVLFS